MADRIQQRRDTAARWAQYNPILLEGEVGYVTDDPNQYKIGDGVHAWNELPLRGFDGTLVHELGTSQTAAMSQKGVTEAINNINSNTGVSDYPTFSESTAYSAGDVVNYNGKLYKFTTAHAAGAWTGADVEPYNLKKDIEERYGTYTDNPEFIRVYTDAEGKFLWGIRIDGSIEWAKGVPTPIQNAIRELKDKLETQDIKSLQDAIDVINASLKPLTDTFSYQGNEEFAHVITDADGKVLSSISKDGNKTENLPTNFSKSLTVQNKSVAIKEEVDETFSNVETRIPQELDNQEFISILLDGSGRIIEGITDDGKVSHFLPHSYKEIEVGDMTLRDSNDIRSISENIPNYYNDYLDSISMKILSKITNSGIGFDGFFFVTDSHTGSNALRSGHLIAELMARTGIGKGIFGGDIVIANIENDYSNCCKHIFNPIKKAGVLLVAKGNHDFNCPMSDSGKPDIALTQQSSVNMLRGWNDKKIISNDNDSECCYGYYDEPAKKLRYIILDTTDYVHDTSIAWSNENYRISDTQFFWIVDNAILTTPAEYGLVFIAHCPMTKNTGIGSDWTGINGTYQDIVKIMEGINNKEPSITLRSKSYNLLNLNNVDVICMINGHMHKDMQTYQNGVLHITTANDSLSPDLPKSPFFHDFIPPRQINTIYEQLFDAYIVDRSKKTVETIRFGAGFDRTFNLKNIKINVGEETSLQSKFTNISRWVSYDNDSATQEDGVIEYTSNVVSVSNGNIHALTRGEATVFAEDASQNKEFFYISVI